IASILAQSADALLNGGTAPAVWGDDDETRLTAAHAAIDRAQLRQERRLVADLTATGDAILAHRSVSDVPLRAHEKLSVSRPIGRLRVLAALTSNVSLNAARTIASADDRNVNHLIIVQAVLGALGLFTSLLLGWALIVAARRQTAHFRSLVTSSTDLVLVLGADGCRYVSQSVTSMLGHPEVDILGGGFVRYVHDDDRSAVEATLAHGKSTETVFRVLNRF